METVKIVNNKRKQGNPAFKPGVSGNINGRPKGAKGKFAGLKEVFLKVFENLQSDKDASLPAFAKKHPRDFYSLVARMLPTKIEDIEKTGRTIIVIGSNGDKTDISG